MTEKYENPIKIQVTATLDINLVEKIDNLRGKKSRSAWINDAIEYTLMADNTPYTEEDLNKMYQEHILNLRKMNAASKGKRKSKIDRAQELFNEFHPQEE